jgi:RNA polymerase sigma-70 factor (ECF subfamily)
MRLAPVFLGRLAREEDGRTAAALDARLEALFTRGAAAWPAVNLPANTFVEHLAGRFVDQPVSGEALDGLQAEDLFLAIACERGDPVALAALHERFLAPLEDWLRRRYTGSIPADEIRQLLGIKLLVAEGGASPRIASYAGRGPLAAWLRISGTRVFLNALRDRRDDEALRQPDAFASVVLAPNPELGFVRARHRADFREAFAAGLATLTAKERNLLRFHFLHGMTGDDLATMHGVARRTVHRWIEQARARILAQTRLELARRLKVSDAELDSLLSLLRSEFASTAAAYLASARPG